MRRVFNFFFFASIFVIYFSSSVGLMNSLDTPQYFTTEAILKYGNINMAPFRSDPHYYVHPDYLVRNGEELSMRGYLMSVLASPLHVAGDMLKDLFTVRNFPSPLHNVANMEYELAVVSLFTLFSVAGLVFVFYTCLEVTGGDSLSSYLTTFLFAFGTYIWKYSATYTRHGVLVFLLGLMLYASVRAGKATNKARWFTVFFAAWSLLFGIDIIAFAVVSLWIAIQFCFFLIRRKYKTIRALLPGLGIAVLVIGLNIYFNNLFYGSFTFSQAYGQNIILKDYVDKIPKSFWFSTPLFPTLFTVLFGAGRMPDAVFSSYAHAPAVVAQFVSLAYAKQYEFNGIFTVSPFLLLAVFGFWRKTPQKSREILFFGVFMFMTGILITTKYFVFWGGNQYDIRCFYPYVVGLGPLVALGIKRLLNVSAPVKYLFYITALALAGWSLFMGLLGDMNMYMPALMGERRAWLDVLQFPSQISHYRYRDLVNAAFMNRENAWIAVFISLFVAAAYLAVTSFSGGHKTARHISHSLQHPPKKKK